MQVIVHGATYGNAESIDNFLNFYYSLKMQHLASELLDKGLSPRQISKAVDKAVRIAKSSGMEVHKHFMPIFSGVGGAVVQDCRLSRLAYGLVFMNADEHIASVGQFQRSVLENFLSEMA